MSVSQEVVSFMWDSTVLEKGKTIKYCLIVENLPLKIYIVGFCLIIIEFVFFTGDIIFFALFVIYVCGFFIYYYVFKTYVCGYIYCNKWDLKPPCQTRKSV